MSRPQYGNSMDRSAPGDIIRRARERAEAGLPREDYNTFLERQRLEEQPTVAPSIPPRNRPVAGPASGGPSRLPRPQAPPGFQNRDGQITLPISRPAPVPQWPLAGPLVSPASSSDSEPYRPPAGSQPPQRPPRPSPSKVPSMLDASKIQDYTPVFQYQPQNNRDSENIPSSVPETPSTLSRPSTLSSVGSIPDFPLPVQAPAPPPPPTSMAPPRRSVNLGPPPSARRGASSFYSHLSYVSPIPEESPRSRSHTSFASSAAMPESWGTPSPAQSPRHIEAFFDDAIVEERSQSDNGYSMYDGHSYDGHSAYDEDGDESRLVRSASIGRRGKANLVTTQSRELNPGEVNQGGQRPSASPVQPGPFTEDTSYLETSTNSSSTVPSTKTPVGAALTADAMLSAYDAASSMDPRASRRMSVSPQPPQPQQPRSYNRLSAIRRPPRLDIDAVREAESRGSLTSLPDLIRRATRLAASLDRGRRPASRFDDPNDFPPEFYGGKPSVDTKNVDKESDEWNEKYQSGLSDMLAAFPPPAQAQSRGGFRQSLREQALSWPLPPNRSRNSLPPQGQEAETRSDEPPQRRGRRCCGMPLWVFFLLVISILILITAAVVLPLEFFVIRKQNVNNASAEAEQQCQQQVTCQNGGTNIVTNGFCSCICTNGFTGFDCSVSDSAGCTSANIQGETNISNVTVGDAIPRLISQAAANFSITLSDTEILSKLNAGNLSCSAENALVTFDGRNTRVGSGNDVVTDNSSDSTTTSANVAKAAIVDSVEGIAIATVTVMAGESTTTTLTLAVQTAGNGIASSPLVSPTIGATVSSILPTTTVTITKTITSNSLPSSTASSVASTTSSAPTTTGTSTAFSVTEEVVDFARVGVLFVLQQDSLTDAELAQTALQRFFSLTSSNSSSSQTTIAAASNLTLSNGNTIDLVNFRIDAGTGLVGKKPTTSRRRLLRDQQPE